MVLPQVHHILPSLSTSTTLQNLSAQFGLSIKWGIMIFLKSCHARKDASLTVKQNQTNRNMNVRFRAEDQGNFHVLYVHPFGGISAFVKCTRGVRPNANPFLEQRKSLPACLETDLEHIPSPCAWERACMAVLTGV